MADSSLFGTSWIASPPIRMCARSRPGRASSQGRSAVAAPGPRVVVFDVAGEIDLRSDLRILEPHLTIAGETAPDRGVVLRGASILVEAGDVVLQHIGIFPGPSSDPKVNEGRDAVTILGDTRRARFSVQRLDDEGHRLGLPAGSHQVNTGHTLDIAEGIDELCGDPCPLVLGGLIFVPVHAGEDRVGDLDTGDVVVQVAQHPG